MSTQQLFLSGCTGFLYLDTIPVPSVFLGIFSTMQFWKPFITSLLPANSIVAKPTPTSTVSVNTNSVGSSAGTVASSFIAKPRADRLSNVPNKRRTLQPLAPRQHTPSFSLTDFISAAGTSSGTTGNPSHQARASPRRSSHSTRTSTPPPSKPPSNPLPPQ